jgi:tetratricopeptide (TPR) repeat protein
MFGRKTQDEKLENRISKLLKTINVTGTTTIQHFDEILQLYDNRISLAFESGNWRILDEIWHNKHLAMIMGAEINLIDDRKLFEFYNDSLDLPWHDDDNFGLDGEVNTASVMFFLIQFLHRRGQYDHALEIFKKFSTIFPHSQVAEIEKGELTDELTVMIVDNVEQARGYYHKGLELVAEKQYGNACEYFIRSIELNPGFTNYRRALYDVLIKLGKMDEGMYQITMIIEMDEKNYKN